MKLERVLGIIESEEPGPLIICIAAVHGNEQIGIHAFRNVYSSIIKHEIALKGKLVGILGNIKAIQNSRRYIDIDMNRTWYQEHTDRAQSGDTSIAEYDEMKAVMDIIEEESQGDFAHRVMVDLHSTSSEKGNFIVLPHDEADDPIIKSLKLPVVIGLNEYLKGTMLEYYHHRGFLAFAFEGGVMGTEQVYQLHTSGLWEILDKAGAITHHDHELEDHYSKLLTQACENLPSQVKTVYRHEVNNGDGFKMLPGYANFQSIKKGQHIALNDQGDIYAPSDGMIFLPLYQQEGDDGFFIVKEL